MKGAVIATGYRELDRKLASLEPKIQKKVGRKVLRDAVKAIVLPKAKAGAPIDTGQLEKSLTVRAMKRSRKARIGFEVTTGGKNRKGEYFYGWFHEFGTKHMKSDPFLRPAGYSSEGEIRDVLAGGIRTELKKLKSRPRS